MVNPSIGFGRPVRQDLYLSGRIDTDNIPPELPPLGPFTVAEGSPLAFTVTASDPDSGQTLTYSLDPGAPAGALIDPTSGFFSWTPLRGPGDSPYSVTVRVTDSGDPRLSATRTFLVQVLNVAPVVDAGPPASATRGVAFSRTGTFSDPGAGAWRASVDYGDGGGPQELALGADRSFLLGHTYAIAGQYTLTVTAVDDSGGVGMARIAVMVTDPAPAVERVVVGDGSPQRSMIGTLTVLFNRPVALKPGAIELRDRSGRRRILSVTTSVVDGRTVALVRVLGPGTFAGSLRDGRFTLIVRWARVTDPAGRALQDVPASPTTYTFTFTRLFGDANGDGRVDAHDAALFRESYGTTARNPWYRPFFDFNSAASSTASTGSVSCVADSALGSSGLDARALQP